MNKQQLLVRRDELELLIKTMVAKGEFNPKARDLINEYFDILKQLNK